jgi:hypothetical protein
MVEDLVVVDEVDEVVVVIAVVVVEEQRQQRDVDHQGVEHPSYLGQLKEFYLNFLLMMKLREMEWLHQSNEVFELLVEVHHQRNYPLKWEVYLQPNLSLAD